MCHVVYVYSRVKIPEKKCFCLFQLNFSMHSRQTNDSLEEEVAKEVVEEDLEGEEEEGACFLRYKWRARAVVESPPRHRFTERSIVAITLIFWRPLSYSILTDVAFALFVCSVSHFTMSSECFSCGSIESQLLLYKNQVFLCLYFSQLPTSCQRGDDAERVVVTSTSSASSLRCCGSRPGSRRAKLARHNSTG